MSRKSPAEINALLGSLRKEYQRLYVDRDFASALSIVRQAHEIWPGPEILKDEALCLLRLDRAPEAYAIGKSLPGERLGVSYLDLMAEVCGQLGQTVEAVGYGNLALQGKDEEVANRGKFRIPGGPPPASSEGQNVISFSLFGGSPRYCEGAILNCEAVAQLLPEWKCRFYCDASVPGDVIRRLKETGAEVIIVDGSTHERIPPLMWRFLVADDPAVTRFLVRDADSIIREREQAAVAAWLASDRWFHVMRDWFTHTELILAGLWGGCTGVFPKIEGLISDFLAAGNYTPTHVDQYFLRASLWPTIRQSVLSHDSQFDFFNNEPFPVVEGAKADGEHHIGANVGTFFIEGKAQVPNGEKITWRLLDRSGEEICSYQTVVRDGLWRDNIPNVYARKVEERVWTVQSEVQRWSLSQLLQKNALAPRAGTDAG
jgi:hypothetical protein